MFSFFLKNFVVNSHRNGSLNMTCLQDQTVILPSEVRHNLIGIIQFIIRVFYFDFKTNWLLSLIC